MAKKAQILVEAVDNTKAALASVDRNLQGVQSAADRVSHSFQAVLGATGAMMIGRAMLSNAMEAEQASNRLTAVLRATGNAAGFTKDQLDELADSMAGVTQFDDESIREAAATFLKFGNIAGGVFKEGMKLAADYAAFTGTNIPEAAQVIGKALSSPTEGISALERQIGKLSSAQEDSIKHFMQQGRQAEAAGVVLDALKQKIGGTAEIMNTGLTGNLKSITKNWNEMLEAAGKTERGEAALRGLATLLGDIRGELEGKDTPLSKLMADFAERAAMFSGPIGTGLVGSIKYYRGMQDYMGSMKAKPGVSAQLAPERYAQLYGDTDVAATAKPRGKTKEQEDLEKRYQTEYNRLVAGGMGYKDAQRYAGDFSMADPNSASSVALQRRNEQLLAAIKSAEAAKDEAFKAAEQRYYDEGQLNKKQVEDTKAGYAEVLKSNEESTRAYYESLQDAADAAQLARVAEIRENQEALEKLKDMATQVAKTNDVARDLGLVFSSSFEDAIVKGGELRDVVRGLGQDILRIAARKTVTEPMAAALSLGLTAAFGGITQRGDVAQAAEIGDAFGGYGGGGGLQRRATGGPVSAGTPYLVGENGPELLVPRSAGTIIPNDELGGGGITFNQTFNVGGNVSREELANVAEAAKQGAIAGVMQQARNSPAFSRALSGR